MHGRLTTVLERTAPTALAAFVAQGLGAVASTGNIFGLFVFQFLAGFCVGLFTRGSWKAAMLGACASGTAFFLWLGARELVIVVSVSCLLALCGFTPGFLFGSVARPGPRSLGDPQDPMTAPPLPADGAAAGTTGAWSVAQMGIRTGPVTTGERRDADRSKILVALLILGSLAFVVGDIWWTLSRYAG
ncbi:MAG: hypothetical protein ACHQNA_12780 [Acidimicrobiales bacterium]